MVWKFCVLLCGLTIFLFNVGNIFLPNANVAQNYFNKRLASDYPGPIAPIGPESPPQPVDDEAIT